MKLIAGGDIYDLPPYAECEQWRPVTKAYGYEVSDLGRVRSLDRRVTFPDGRSREAKGRVLKQTAQPSGHLSVALPSLPGSSRLQRTVSVHRLVLSTFVGPCPADMEGCHNNGNPADNRLSNLRWDSRAANRNDQFKHGTDGYAFRDHCSAGHPYTEENTRIYKGRYRCCRSCERARRMKK